MKLENAAEIKEQREYYRNNWNSYAKNILKVDLDPAQQEILEAIQNNKRVSVRSGNARGKDFVAAVAAVCFINLCKPSKVICTAPTGRQAVSIMMAEISSLYKKGLSASNKISYVGGEVQANRIKFKDKNRFLLAFKASDTEVESWTGFHSPNLMVVVTEASGISDMTFNSIESILTGNSRLVIVFNPNITTGEAYRSTRDDRYKSFKLNCLDAPNVKAKQTLIPGQVDYDWVADKVRRWSVEIPKTEAIPENYDFEFEGKWHKPNDLFRVKVLGEFPSESDDQLIPVGWIEAAFNRHKDIDINNIQDSSLKLGVDVAGMGSNMTVFCKRYGNIVTEFKVYAKSDHMATVGKIVNELKTDQDFAFIDTIGEGAGVHSRLIELGAQSISAKFSEMDNKLTDITQERTFVNMRAYCYWSIRDALDPKLGYNLAIPEDNELLEELTETKYTFNSQGKIQLEKKDDIKQRLGRSPDKADALALSFYPHRSENWSGIGAFSRVRE